MGPVRDRIRQIGQTQPDMLAALATIQILCKTNAAIIRAAAAPVPERWLQLLEAPDTDILIG